jgi:hypothetical protein
MLFRMFTGMMPTVGPAVFLHPIPHVHCHDATVGLLFCMLFTMFTAVMYSECV